MLKNWVEDISCAVMVILLTFLGFMATADSVSAWRAAQHVATPGTYVVTEYHVNMRSDTTVGVFYPDEAGMPVLDGVVLAEDRSPVGTRVASWYSPSWRDSTPGVPVLVNRGDWGGVSSSLILAVCVDAIIVPVWIALLVLYAVPGITWVVRRVTG